MVPELIMNFTGENLMGHCECGDNALYDDDFQCAICGKPKAGPCHKCGKSGLHRPEFRSWAYCDSCLEEVLTEIDIAMVTHENDDEAHSVVDRLSDLADEIERKRKKTEQ